MRVRWFRGAIVCALVMGAPALADVKSGVDAWQRGDYRAAIAAWRGPADAGDADAQFNLGQAYKLGKGVPVDLQMAQDYYGKAARQGHRQAEDNYGLALFENNRREEALPWLEKSAARGEPRAQYVLGTMFFNADGVKRDWVRAYALMIRASSAGLKQATTTLAQMDRYIGLEERQRGVALARTLESTAPRSREPAQVVQAPDTPRDTRAPGAALATAADRMTTPRARPTPPVPKPRAAPAIRDGGWRVQLGAFRDVGNARTLWSQVEGRFPARGPYYIPSGGLTRLLVGPFASRAEAQRACGAVKPCVPVRR
jgi:cell division septation protein DedD